MLISRNDVVRIKMPFPNIKSELAVNSHMYICHKVCGTATHFVKCQTLKPYMLFSTPMKHYWDEKPDITRNPFKAATPIDCDKEFITFNVRYDERLKTTARPDVCDDVMRHIDRELCCEGYDSNKIAEEELLALNKLIYRI